MKPTENIAVIDIGSNTLRLLIGNIKANKINKIYTDRVVTQLGKNLIKKGVITEKAINSSIITLKNFKKISEKFNVSCIIAVGTSALREAKNSLYFCKTVKQSTGIYIHIISGKEEAYYTLHGVMDEELKEENSVFIIDIGGGSTEWIHSSRNNFKIGSMPIGALKIKERFLNKEPYSEEEISNAKKFIKEEIRKSLPQVKIDRFITTGGTASTLGMINFELSEYIPEKIHMAEIGVAETKQILKKLLSISLKERKKIKGMPSDRADIICAGLLILEEVADYLNAEKLNISENGIMEGIMKNYKNFCYNNTL
ncbi:Ppx/GppA phosphatase family protein [Thermodesulfovibrio sp. TK110]